MKFFLMVPTLFLCFLFLLSGVSRAEFSTEPEDITEACQGLAWTLSKNIPFGKTVGVRRFSTTGGFPSLLSIRIQDLLTSALSGLHNRKFHVVERLRMAELDLERLTHGSGNGDDLDRWAQKLKADLIVMGTYGEVGGSLKIDCRLVAPESGRSPGAADTKLPFSMDIRRLARTPAPSNPAVGVFEAIVSPEPKGNKNSFVRLFRVRDGKPAPFAAGKAPAFRVGEFMGFSVCPPMDCRLYIFNYDPQGEDESVIFVYPLPQVPARTFSGSKSYAFPECVDPRAVSYPVEPPLGRMVFKVIGVASDASHGDLVDGLDGSKGWYQLHWKDLKPLIQKLMVLPRSAWWEESADFWVME